MDSRSAPQASKRPGAAGPFSQQWVRIAETLLFGAAGGLVFDAARFPAGWLAGAMVFCAAAALLGRPIGLPRPLARAFYVIVGIALGSAVDPTALRGAAAWPLSIALVALAMTCVTLATMTYLRRVHGWDAMTALFAGYPGALAQVMAHATEEDCDIRAVAVVQTIRVVILTIGIPAALAAFGLTGAGSLAAHATSFADAPVQMSVLLLVSVAVGLGLLRLGLPGGLLIGPMVVSAILHGAGLVSVALPAWVTVVGMVGIGSVGGARFAGTPARPALAYLWAALGSCAISLGIAAAFAAVASLIIAEPAGDIDCRVSARRARCDDGARARARSRPDFRRRPSPRALVRPVACSAFRDPLGARTARLRLPFTSLNVSRDFSGSRTARLTWINAAVNANCPMSAIPPKLVKRPQFRGP